MLYSTHRLLQQSLKLRDDSQALIANSRIIKAQSVTLVARSKQVSAAIAAAEAEMMQHSFLHPHAPISISLTESRR